MRIRFATSMIRAIQVGPILLAFFLGAVTISPATAGAAQIFCPVGSGAGQCKNSLGVAVNWATGNVYVVDQGNHRVNVFDEEGAFLFSFGSQGSDPGQFSTPSVIAIDNDPASPGHESVYVGMDRYQVQKFTPQGVFQLAFGSQGPNAGQFNNNGSSGANAVAIAVAGASGTVYVAERDVAEVGRVQQFSPAGAHLGESHLSEPPTADQALDNLAVDSGGDLYLAYGGSFEDRGLWKHGWAEPIASFLGRFDVGSDIPRIRWGLAISSTDDVYASQLIEQLDRGRRVITRYASDGQILHRFGYGEFREGNNNKGIAINADSTTVYYSAEAGESGLLTVPPPGPIIVPGSVVGDDLRNTSAEITGEINSEGATSTYHAEYIEEAEYQADIGQGGDGYTDAIRVPESPSDDPDVGGPNDFGLGKASLSIGCLDPATEAGQPGNDCLLPSTTYRVRLHAENVDGPGPGAMEGIFETKPPLDLLATWSSHLGIGSARLNAEVNPFGILASGTFQYVDESSYFEDLTAGGDGFAGAMESAEVSFGAGSAGEKAGISVDGLTPGAYRYRAVVDNVLIEPIFGPVRRFTTRSPTLPGVACPNDEFRVGPGSRLPNCRAYEMVSPVDKEGGDVVALGNINSNPARHNQSAIDGGRLTYSSYRAFGEVQSSPFTSQYLATRDPGSGWVGQAISPPRGVNILKQGDSLDVEFKAFSTDLCRGWLRHDTDPPLALGAISGFANLYRRDNCGSNIGSFSSLTTVKPSLLEPIDYAPELKAVSADGAAAAFTVPDRLTALPVGSQLDCSDGNTEGSVSYSWLRNGVVIPGAVASIYTSTSADAEKAVQCRVRATTPSAGSTRIANPPVWIGTMPNTEVPTAPSSLGAPGASAPLVVGGGGGQMLTCAAEGEKWASVDTFSYQWYRNGSPISGATSENYSLTTNDLLTPASFQCAAIGTGSQGSVAVASDDLLTDPPPASPGVPKVEAGMPSASKCYLSRGDELNLVSILPNGRATREPCWVGLAESGYDDGRGDSVFNAVSQDGSRVFWTSSRGPGQVYVWIDGDPTVAVSGAISSASARFRGASLSGDRAILTVDDGSAPGDGLFEVEVDAEEDHQIAAEVLGVLGMSEDARRVYFVSREEIDGKGSAGAPNLYLHNSDGTGGGTIEFVGTLTSEDAQASGFHPSPISTEPRYRLSRVSADGSHAVFMSAGSLTGYDNTDLISDEPAAEVYRYEASDGSGSGSLACISCNPTGARPIGRELLREADLSTDVWAAARISTTDSHLYSPRVMSNDGSRIYFESYESLVTRDTNGTRADVYQWQLATSADECRELGAEQFVEEAEGCLSLISSGESGKDSEFIDASANGNDVFIATDSSLVEQDPGLIDIYDVRVGGGFPPPAKPKGPCSGESCQSPPPPPEAPTPSSSSFHGAGNVPRNTSGKNGRCPKGKVRKAGRCTRKRGTAKKVCSKKKGAGKARCPKRTQSTSTRRAR